MEPKSGHEDLGSLLMGLEAGDFDDDDQELGGASGADPSKSLSSSLPSPQSSPSKNSVPSFAGFSTAGGSKLPPPSKAAMQKALELVTSAEKENDHSISPLKRKREEEVETTPRSLFSTASGVAIAPPSKTTLQRVAAIFDEPTDVPSHDTSSTTVNMTPARAGGVPLFTTGKGSTIAPPTEAARKAVARMFDDVSIPSKSPALGSSSQPRSKSIITPLEPNTSHMQTPSRLTSNPSAGPSRLSSQSRGRPIDLKTPVSTRRLGMGKSSTPSSASRQRAFVTPFSKKAPVPLTTKIRGPQPAPPRPTPMRASGVLSESCRDVQRPTYREAYLKPQYYDTEDLVRHGIPNEITAFDLKAASSVTIDSTRSRLNVDNAYGTLLEQGHRLVTKAWVINHWSLILWKLAGEIQAQPSLYPALWSADEILRQLHYRYDREYNLAQRPLVRKLRERDAPPTIPMVLCISAIKWIEKEPEAEGAGAPQLVAVLELTDGWYHISAQIDGPLTRAVSNRKIQVGRKLSICGAKFASGGEAEDPLEQSNGTVLLINGNCCSLAAWDAKLGRRLQPPLSTLGTLSVDGGMIPLMEVVVEKLFPAAYVNVGQGAGEAPWDVKEESRRAMQWRDQRESEISRLNGEADQAVASSRQILEALLAQAEGFNGGGSPGDDDQRRFDALINSHRSMSLISIMSMDQAARIVSLAQNHYENDLESRRSEIMQEIETLCPPRNIQSFRFIRVIDGRLGNREPQRTAMLRIWDYDQMERDLLKEGNRYIVSNLMPGRNGDWAVPKPKDTGKREVYLNTRRDTRWYPSGVGPA